MMWPPFTEAEVAMLARKGAGSPVLQVLDIRQLLRRAPEQNSQRLSHSNAINTRRQPDGRIQNPRGGFPNPIHSPNPRDYRWGELVPGGIQSSPDSRRSELRSLAGDRTAIPTSTTRESGASLGTWVEARKG